MRTAKDRIKNEAEINVDGSNFDPFGDDILQVCYQYERMQAALELIAERQVDPPAGYEGYRHGEAMGMQRIAKKTLEEIAVEVDDE